MPKHTYFYTYADTLKQRSEDAEKRGDSRSSHAYLTALVEFYECLNKSSILKDQKNYTKDLIKQLSPSYYEGYFKPKKQKK